MNCSVQYFFQMLVSIFLVIYGFAIIMGVMQIINGIQSRNQRTRAEEDLLGIKPSWMTEYQRQNQDVETSVYAGASLFSRIFRPAAVITVSVLSLVVAIALTVSACS